MIALMLALQAVASGQKEAAPARRPVPSMIHVGAVVRPLVSGPAPLESLGRRVWSAYDFTDTLLIQALVDSAALAQNGGRCQLLVQISIQVAHAPPSRDGTESGIVRGATWLPPLRANWVSCPDPEQLAVDHGQIAIGEFEPDATLGRLRDVDFDATLLAMRVDVTLVGPDHRRRLGSLRGSRVFQLSMLD